MTIQTPQLPYSLDALEPHISAETLEYHYGKHHKSYVDKLNKLLPGSNFEESSLEQIVKDSEGNLFNNAAQVWNHSFYWNSLSPNGGGSPGGDLGKAITQQYGSFEKFKEEFTRSAKSNFGSGWTWLVKTDSGELAILNTSNAETPLASSSTKALLTVDVWEHAYYIDYRNSRGEYLEAFWALVNWEFAAENFS
ncbi:MAG: superoxide dismutase [Fe] [Halioglobus sp.]|nr:superoxide dismutase [Fe] [Halioglobus sp.]